MYYDLFNESLIDECRLFPTRFYSICKKWDCTQKAFPSCPFSLGFPSSPGLPGWCWTSAVYFEKDSPGTHGEWECENSAFSIRHLALPCLLWAGPDDRLLPRYFPQRWRKFPPAWVFACLLVLALQTRQGGSQPCPRILPPAGLLDSEARSVP